VIKVATKAKPKAKSTTKAKAKPRARKAPANKAKSQVPQAVIANGRFAPGVDVGFWPAHEVAVERAAGQQPFPKATKTVTVHDDGSIPVSGLESGAWIAAAETGEYGHWTYVAFSVKD